MNDENEYWILFRPIFFKYQSEGKISFCEYWWRSRYSDKVVCPSSTKDVEEFKRQKKAARNWIKVWEILKVEIDKQKQHLQDKIVKIQLINQQIPYYQNSVQLLLFDNAEC